MTNFNQYATQIHEAVLGSAIDFDYTFSKNQIKVYHFGTVNVEVRHNGVLKSNDAKPVLIKSFTIYPNDPDSKFIECLDYIKAQETLGEVLEMAGLNENGKLN